MFEAYTERARRIIFYARFESSKSGSLQIETEHLLLGLLREVSELAARFLPTNVTAGTVRAQISYRNPKGPPLPTSVDLPLSEASKRVLARAAEEAAALGHQFIGTEHLFLALLLEPSEPTAQLLIQMGASADQVRRYLATAGPESGGNSGVVAGVFGSGSGTHRFARPPAMPLTLQLVGEDGSSVAEICWAARIGRLPHIGECVEIHVEDQPVRYRILDVRWKIAHNGTTLTQQGDVVLTVREELMAGGQDL